MAEIGILDITRESGRILELWRRTLGDKFPLDERLLSQQIQMETSERLCLGVFVGNALIASALAKRVSRPGLDGLIPPEGNISFMMVDQASQRQGIGAAMLRKIEIWLGGRGVRTLQAGADTWHFFPGVPGTVLESVSAGNAAADKARTCCSKGSHSVSQNSTGGVSAAEAFFRANGFVSGTLEHDVAADLGEIDLVSLGGTFRHGAGYSIRPYEPNLRDDTRAFFARAFPNRWMLDTFAMIDAGMRGRDLLLLQENAGGRIVGFALLFDEASSILGPGVYWRALMGANPGGLGPIGVDDSVRGQGLGLFLLHAGLTELKARGVRFTVIDWTDLVNFYAKMGFRIWKSYRMYSKRILI